MKKIIVLLFIVLVFGKDAVAQENKVTDFQVYSTALYLIQQQPVEMKDTIHFLLDKEWIKTIGIYLKDFDNIPDSMLYPGQRLDLPAIENLGVVFQFYSKVHAMAWFKTTAVQQFIKKTKVEVSFALPSWARYSNYYADSSMITLSSDKHINWYVVMQWFQQNCSPDFLSQYGYFSARMAENPISKKYDSKPCADKCDDYIFHVDYENKNNIIFGHTSNYMSNGWQPVGWSFTYAIDSRKFTKAVSGNYPRNYYIGN